MPGLQWFFLIVALWNTLVMWFNLWMWPDSPYLTLAAIRLPIEIPFYIALYCCLKRLRTEGVYVPPQLSAAATRLKRSFRF